MYRALHPECCLFQQRLEDGVGSVLVELDAYLGPQLVRKVVQLPTSSHRHQQSLRLLLNSKLRNVHGAGISSIEPPSAAEPATIVPPVFRPSRVPKLFSWAVTLS